MQISKANECSVPVTIAGAMFSILQVSAQVVNVVCCLNTKNIATGKLSNFWRLLSHNLSLPNIYITQLKSANIAKEVLQRYVWLSPAKPIIICFLAHIRLAIGTQVDQRSMLTLNTQHGYDSLIIRYTTARLGSIFSSQERRRPENVATSWHHSLVSAIIFSVWVVTLASRISVVTGSSSGTDVCYYSELMCTLATLSLLFSTK